MELQVRLDKMRCGNTGKGREGGKVDNAKRKDGGRTERAEEEGS